MCAVVAGERGMGWQVFCGSWCLFTSSVVLLFVVWFFATPRQRKSSHPTIDPTPQANRPNPTNPEQTTARAQQPNIFPSPNGSKRSIQWDVRSFFFVAEFRRNFVMSGVLIRDACGTWRMIVSILLLKFHTHHTDESKNQITQQLSKSFSHIFNLCLKVAHFWTINWLLIQ